MLFEDRKQAIRKLTLRSRTTFRRSAEKPFQDSVPKTEVLGSIIPIFSTSGYGSPIQVVWFT